VMYQLDISNLKLLKFPFSKKKGNYGYQVSNIKVFFRHGLCCYNQSATMNHRELSIAPLVRFLLAIPIHSSSRPRLFTGAHIFLNLFSYFSEFISGFNHRYSFSGRRHACRLRDACGDFLNLEDLQSHSLGGAHRYRITCVYS